MEKYLDTNVTAFIRDRVRETIEDEVPDELSLVDSIFEAVLSMDSVPEMTYDTDEAYFGEEMSILSPFLIDIARDVVKEMIVAGVALSARAFWERVSLKKEKNPKKTGRRNAITALSRTARRRDNQK